MSGSTLNTISPFLKEADKLVKNGNLQDALVTIRKALTAAPGNLYVQAYEANVLSLLEKKQATQKELHERDTATEQLHNLARVTLEDIGRTEQLASTLISTHDEIQQQASEQEKKMKLSEEKLNARVEQFIRYATDLAKEKKYLNALDEINRAYVIDPQNKILSDLEHEIRRDYEIEIAKQQVEQQRMKNEEKQLLEDVARSQKTQTLSLSQKKTEMIDLLFKQAKQDAETGRFESAMSVILKGLSIHPTHTGLLDLHKRVSNAIIEQKVIEKEIERRKVLAQKRFVEENNQKASMMLQEVRQCISDQQFSRASKLLKSVEQIQPQNKTAKELRKELQQAQLKALDAIQTQTILPEISVRKKQQDVVTHNSTLPAPLSNAEMTYRLQKARVFQQQCRFEDALGEIAIILVQDPNNDDALTVRNAVTEAQRQLQLLLQEQVLQAKESENVLLQKQNELAAVLEKIQELRKHKEYSHALDEIAHAIILDPFNDTLTKLEQEIRCEEKEHTAGTSEDQHLIAQQQFLETLRNAKSILLKSGYIDSGENLQTDVALRGLGKELKKKLGKKNKTH
ncbi:MAG: hypothetical protein WCW35_01535 [Bacteroidota bacterium]